MAANSSPLAIWVVRPGDNLTKIVRQAFGAVDNAKIQSHIRDVLALNRNIKNPNVIKVGQVIALAAPEGAAAMANVFETERVEIEKLLCPVDRPTRFLLDNWELLHPLAVQNDFKPGGPTAPTHYQYGNAAKWAYKVVKGGVKAADKTTQGKFGDFVDPHIFRRVEGEVVRDVKRQLQYIRRPDNALGLVPGSMRALRTDAGKVLLVQRDPEAGFYAFSRSVRQSKELAKNILKPAQTVFKALDYGLFAYQVQQAIGKPDAGKVISKETGKLAAGIAWGAGSTAVATGICGFLSLTTGPGGIACFLTVSMAGGYGASQLGEAAGNGLYEWATRPRQQSRLMPLNPILFYSP